jgi:hypothetical protein
MEETTQSRGIWKVTTGFLAVTVCVLGYYLNDTNTLKENQKVEIAHKVEELTTTKVRLDSIGFQLDTKIAEIKSLGGEVEELQAAKKQLESDRIQLKKDSTLSVARYEGKIAEYLKLLQSKGTELTQLKKENGRLLVKNQSLAYENTNLSTENSLLKAVKQILSDSVDHYYRKNLELTATVNQGSALQTQFVKVNAISSSNKERKGGLYRSSKVDKMKIIFQLQSNSIAKEDNKVIYLRVIDPTKAVLYDSSVGSGNFELYGKESTYTVKKDIVFQRGGQNVEIVYGKGSGIQYRMGHYGIELYCEGFKIGDGFFDIK